MQKLSALSLAACSRRPAQAATQTVDCGRLLDVKAGKWRERVSIVVENGIGQVGRPDDAGRRPYRPVAAIPACPALSTCTCT